MKVTLKYIKRNAWSIEEEGHQPEMVNQGFTAALAKVLANNGYEKLLRYIGAVHKGVGQKRVAGTGFLFETTLEDMVRFAEEGRQFHSEVMKSLDVVPEGEKCIVDCDESAIWGLWHLFERAGYNPSDPIPDFKRVGSYELPGSFLIVEANEEQAREVIAPWKTLD